MDDTTKSKYLGDVLDKTGKVRANIEERRAKGFAIVNEILAIVEEIPLGRYRMEIGLNLRQAMLINGILYNSEAWHDINEKEIKRLEEVDEHLLRSLVNGHAKTPLEFIYLETGSLPLRFIISSRRMCFLQIILRRKDSELTKRVYKEQRENPLKGDFYTLVKEDFQNIGEVLDESNIVNTSIEAYKSQIKRKTRIAAFNYLQKKQSTHSKVRDVKYNTLKVQKYITSPLFSDREVSLLFALRSKYVKECKANFRSHYPQDILCKFCDKNEPDDQQHMLECIELNKHIKSQELSKNNIEYSDIFEDPSKQKEVTY